jgi:Tol biopolymer transport system component
MSTVMDTTISPPLEPSTTTFTPLPSPTYTPTLTDTSTPTPAPTLIGGGKGQIAFASDRNGSVQIWTMDTEGNDLQQITKGEDFIDGACQPEWSPDGAQLVFVSPCYTYEDIYDDYHHPKLYIYDWETEAITPLETKFSSSFSPSWSPNGEHIAFIAYDSWDYTQIYLISPASEEIQQITTDFFFSMQPTWSNDGRTIYYVQTLTKDYPSWKIYRKSLDSEKGPEEVFFTENEKYTNPNASPTDENQFLFSVSSADTQKIPELFSLDLGVEKPKSSNFQLNIPARNASFSPDGTKLVFESWPDGSDHEIYMVNADGTELKPLTDNPSNDFDPVWRP